MSNSESSVKHMQCPELQLSLDSDNFVVVDIRDQASYQQGHIPGAIHLTNESLPEFLRDADYDKPTVVCCYHGISSQQAAQFLISHDFTEVYSLDGGFSQWGMLYPEHIAVNASS
ncbi:thiosulfate sulfurtransferase GlpE [Thalassotalea ganghwensis]